MLSPFSEPLFAGGAAAAGRGLHLLAVAAGCAAHQGQKPQGSRVRESLFEPFAP